MKSNKGSLIERYVMEVGRQLPEKLRADVQLELRSALQDALEERGLDADKAEDQKKVAELLKEFGKPSTVAESYGARNYLIGPELMPFYKVILRINVIVITLVNIAGLVLAAASAGDFISMKIDLLGDFFSGLLTSFAVVTIIFALLEKALAGEKLPRQVWDPLTLPELTSDRDRVNIVEAVVELFVLAVAFVIFISVVSGVGPALPVGENWDIVPALIEEFRPYLPLFFAIWAAEFALKLFVVFRGRWEKWTRWAELAVAVGGGILLAFTLRAAPFTEVSLVNDIVQLSIGIGLFFTFTDALFKFYRILRPDSRFPWRAKEVEQAMKDLGKEGEAIGKALDARFKKR